MNRHIILIIGNVLIIAGMMARRYSYASPEKHCVQIDYTNIYGCFGSYFVPALLVWGSTLLGLALIIYSFMQARQSARNVEAGEPQ
jgi:hypothetical protein